MHIQVRSRTTKSGGGFAVGEPGDFAVAAEFQAGALLEMLGVLRDAGFNLRAAGGTGIELDGELAFWVDPRDEDGDHEAAAYAAADTLNGSGYDAWTETVHAVVLDDRPGALRDELEKIKDQGLLVEGVLVGTPGRDSDGRIPVQLRLVRAG